MTTTKRFLFTLLLVILPTPSIGSFDLTFHIRCQAYATWCATICVLEHDPSHLTQYWKVKKVCAKDDKNANLTLHFDTVNLAHNHDPDGDNFFLLTHDCSRSGRPYCTRPIPGIDMSDWDYMNVKVVLSLSDNDGPNTRVTRGECVRKPIS